MQRFFFFFFWPYEVTFTGSRAIFWGTSHRVLLLFFFYMSYPVSQKIMSAQLSKHVENLPTSTTSMATSNSSWNCHHFSLVPWFTPLLLYVTHVSAQVPLLKPQSDHDSSASHFFLTLCHFLFIVLIHQLSYIYCLFVYYLSPQWEAL